MSLPPREPGRPDLLGRRLDDRYEVLRLLGVGGMGVIYAVRPLGALGELAVKVIHERRIHDPRMAERLAGEARAGVMVRHPNVVQTHELGRTSHGLLYLVMELLDGTTLRRSMTAAPLSPARAISIAAQICAGIGEAHRRAVVHCDLKPENVMLCRTATGSDRVKILDFGIAQIRGESPAQRRSPGAGGLPRVAGSLPYMSPEQITNRAVDARGDIYALGVLLHEMLGGALPVTRAGASAPHAQTAPPLEGRMPRAAAEALEQLIRRCREPRPEDRPRSAEVVRDTLARVLAALGDRGPREPVSAAVAPAWLEGGAGCVNLA